ncbi:hypothetical protein [Streptomyces sp. NPDC057909]|uniref:DUF7660 family protein n=1 Tax=Streptomyces sp. NPDC057909 TaxID=3346277 RepID=UPI0036EA8F8D
MEANLQVEVHAAPPCKIFAMESLNDTSWVRTRADLVSYVRQLSQEAQAPSSGWENQSLDRYLEALSAWTSDMDGYFNNRGGEAEEIRAKRAT